MPKAKEKTIIPDEEEETTLHRMVNAEEAKRHALNLDEAIDMIEEGTRTGTTENAMKNAIGKIKAALVEIAPHMEEAKEGSVLKAIKDTSCTALMLPDSDKEERLEAMMPESDAPDLEDILSKAKEVGDLNSKQKELMGELFEELETAHKSLVRACSTLGRLSRGLNGRQLLLTLRASVRPLVQLNIIDKFWKDPVQKTQRTDLPDDLHQRVTLMSDPGCII